MCWRAEGCREMNNRGHERESVLEAPGWILGRVILLPFWCARCQVRSQNQPRVTQLKNNCNTASYQHPYHASSEYFHSRWLRMSVHIAHEWRMDRFVCVRGGGCWHVVMLLMSGVKQGANPCFFHALSTYTHPYLFSYIACLTTIPV